MKVTKHFVCSFVFLIFLRTAVMPRQIAFDSGTRGQNLLLFGRAADTTVAPFVCPGNGNYPVPGQECTNAYYSCGSGNPVLSYCPGVSVFEPTTQLCTSSSSAPCKKNTTMPTSTTANTSTELTSTTPTTPPTDSPMTEVSPTDNFDQSTTKSTLITTQKSTTTVSSTESTLTTQKSTATTTTTKTTEATPFVCPGFQSNGVYPNPSNCNTFYICSNGIPYLYDCPSNLVFNPATGNCDYEGNVSGSCGSEI